MAFRPPRTRPPRQWYDPTQRGVPQWKVDSELAAVKAVARAEAREAAVAAVAGFNSDSDDGGSSQHGGGHSRGGLKRRRGALHSPKPQGHDPSDDPNYEMGPYIGPA